MAHYEHRKTWHYATCNKLVETLNELTANRHVIFTVLRNTDAPTCGCCKPDTYEVISYTLNNVLVED